MIPSLEIEAIAELAARPQWVCWRAEPRAGKTTKVPLRANGSPASSTDPATWGTFAACAEAAVHGAAALRIAGVGYVLSPEDPYVGIDLDGALGEDAHTPEPWAREVLRDLPETYFEVSPSQRGLRGFARGKLPSGWRRQGKVEIYDQGRFLTVTGSLWSRVESIVEWSDLEVWHMRRARPDMGEAPADPMRAWDVELRADASPPAEKLSALLANDRKFRASWDHRRPDLADQSLSTYDLSLASIAVSAAWSDQEIADLVVAHRRMHGGADDLRKALRRDYTIDRVIVPARRGHTAQTTELPELDDVAHDPDSALRPVSETLGVPVRRLRRWGREGAYTYSLGLLRGDEIELGDATALLNQDRIRARLVDAAGIVIPGLKPERWRKVLALLLAHVEEIAVEEAGPTQQVVAWVQSYLDQRPPQAIGESISIGAPFRDGAGAIWITANELRRYIRRARGEDLTERQVATRMRMVGCTAEQHEHSERGIRTRRRYWLVPPSLLTSGGLVRDEVR